MIFLQRVATMVSLLERVDRKRRLEAIDAGLGIGKTFRSLYIPKATLIRDRVDSRLITGAFTAVNVPDSLKSRFKRLGELMHAPGVVLGINRKFDVAQRLA